MKRLVSFILMFLILLTLLFSFPVCNYASEITGNVTAHTSVVTGDTITWQVNFDDSLFLGDPDIYRQGLAKMSLGMAASAFRDNISGKTDDWIEQYMMEAGFENPRSEGYDKAAGEHTVSTYISTKKIGDYTLIAAVDCGGGYGNEWLSNFNVGTGIRHEGFNEAAIEFERRLNQYIDDYRISGKMILWMAGYSRGAAIANLVEADMIESGRFDKVFGYNFAVPRNTKNAVAYGNIFNILGKYDPVTMIPLPEWGYNRNGIDVYTLAQEMDSRYKEELTGPNQISDLIAGKRFSNNPGVNSQLHMVLEYLLQMMPNDSDYERSLKNPIKKAMEKHDLDSLILVLSEALNNIESLDASGQAAAANLLTYVETIITGYLRGNRSDVVNGYWDTQDSMAANIMHEHSPEVYVEWIFGTDSDDVLFTNCFSSRRVVISGMVSIAIYDDEGYIQTINNEGNSFIERSLDNGRYADPIIYTIRQGSQTIMSLPGERSYKLCIHSDKSESAGYMMTVYRVGQIAGETLPIVGFNTKAGRDYILTVSSENETKLTDATGQEISVWKTEGGYSPSVINQIENMNVFHITITGTIIVISCVIVFVVLMIIVVIILAVVHGINCRRRGRPYSKYCVIIPHLMFVLLFFLLAEVTGYIMPVIRILPPLFATLGNITILVIAIRGCMRRSCPRNTGILIGIAILTAGIFCIFYYTGMGVVNWLQFIMMGIYYTAFSALAVYTFPHEGKLKIK